MIDALNVGTLLAAAGIDRREARLLLARATGIADAILVAFPERTIGDEFAARFRESAGRRQRGEPIAYILGEREFYGRVFHVTPAVLIPRPETELLVDLVLESARQFQAARLLDLGTGSGAIAVTLACELADARVTAVDNSAQALGVARGNAARLAAGRVACLESNWFAALGDRQFDVIVANPPYIARADPHLARGDLRFEPASALVGGSAGLECIALIVATAALYLAPGGALLLEHGYDQASSVRDLLADAGYAGIVTHRDLAGCDRVSLGHRAGPAWVPPPRN